MRSGTISRATGRVIISSACALVGIRLFSVCPASPVPRDDNQPPAESPRSVSAPRLTDLTGATIDPFAVRDAKALVFIFISTDCPISNRYAPEIQRLHAVYSSRGIVFRLVYPLADESLESARKHAREFRYSISAVLDPKHALVRLARARVTPEAAVFLPEKRLVYHGRIDDRNVDFGKERPAPTKRDLQEVLEEIVSGKPVTVPSRPAIGCYIPDLP